LFRRIVSEAPFEKNCFRRHCSEDLVLKEEFLTTRTSGHPGLPGHPGRPNSAAEEELFQKHCFRSTVSEALFKKILFRRLGSEGGISDD